MERQAASHSSLLGNSQLTMADSPAHTGKKLNSTRTFKVPLGGPGVLMSVPLPLPVGTLTHYPPGVSGPLSFHITAAEGGGVIGEVGAHKPWHTASGGRWVIPRVDPRVRGKDNCHRLE